MAWVVVVGSLAMNGCHSSFFDLFSYQTEPKFPTATETANGPPEPRDELPRDRPGHVWVYGHYAPNPDGTWSWQKGYYKPDRPGYLWVQGNLEEQADGRYVWHEGYWVRRER